MFGSHHYQNRDLYWDSKTRTTTSRRFSQCLSSAHAWTSVILAGKRCNRRHSTSGFSKNTVVEREREGLTSFNKDNSAIFSGESKVQWIFPGCLLFYFLSTREKTFSQTSSRPRTRFQRSLITLRHVQEIIANWKGFKLLNKFFLSVEDIAG